MANLLITAVRPTIGPIVLNCTIRERHSGDIAISEAPIEDGSTLADHALILPKVLEIEGVISPYPDNPADQIRMAAGFVADSIRRGKPRSSADYAADVWARIRALASSLETFDVTTDREHYKSMLFEHYECTDTNNAGTTFLIATLRQVQFAKTKFEPFPSDDVKDPLSSTADVGVQQMEALP